MDRERTKAGHVIDGRFRLDKLVGGGGAAAVWLAEDIQQPGITVALKLLHPRFRPIPEAVDRFKRESQLLAELKHPAIAAIRGEWSEGSPQPYIVLEYVEGKTLARQMSIRAFEDQAYSNEEVLRIFGPLCAAIELAHQRGVVHRDLKPSNIMISDALEVKVLDFGVAKLLDASPHDQTTRGRQLGSYAYMSPEEAAAEAIDVRSDVFGLGSILYEVLTLRHAWMRGANESPLKVGDESSESATAILDRVQSNNPPQPSLMRADLSQEIDDVVITALASRPDDRFQSVADFHRELQDALMGATAIADVPLPPTQIFTSQPDKPQPVPTAVVRHSEDTMPTVPPQEDRPRPPTTEVQVDREVTTLLGTEVRGYRVLEHLGSGTFSHVFRAQHTHLGRQVAIKVLRSTFVTSETVPKRMGREAEALARLAHPNIVTVVDFGVMPDGRPFMVMELLHGRNLSVAISEEAPFDATRVAGIAHQIAQGLAAAHQQEFIHRDLKPGNIILVPTEGGELAKILDFGIARAMAQEHERTRLTRANELLGTPAYMAPEQIFGAANVGPKADLYALGVIMYTMFTGLPPFVGTPSEVLTKLQTDAPAPLPSAGKLESMVLSLLSKQPEMRPDSAQEIVQTLESTLGDKLIQPSMVFAASRPNRANLLHTLGITGAFVFSLIALLVVMFRDPRLEAPRPTTPTETIKPLPGAEPAPSATPGVEERSTVVSEEPKERVKKPAERRAARKPAHSLVKKKKRNASIATIRKLLREARQHPQDHAILRRLEKAILERVAMIEDAKTRARIERITVSSAMTNDLDGMALAVEALAAL